MKKLHSLVFCALVTPAMALGASSALAQQTPGQQGIDRAPASQGIGGSQQGIQGDGGRAQEGLQREHGAAKSPGGTEPGDYSAGRAGQTGSQAGTDMQQGMRDQARTESRGYMSSVPTDGMRASNLVGANVKTSNNDDVGSVSDLLLDKDGQVVGIIVGVGGFLGMGESDVAVGWDDVTTSGASGDLELRIESTSDALRSAPKFEMQD